MSTIGNILWLLFGGAITGLLWGITGIIWSGNVKICAVEKSPKYDKH